MGRRTKTLIPTMGKLLKPKIINPKSVQKELLKRKATQKYYYDRHTKPLSKLKESEPVLIQVKDIVTTPQGTSYRRNKRHLRKASERHGNSQNLEEEYGSDKIYDNYISNNTEDDKSPPKKETNNCPPVLTTTTLR